MSEKLSQVEASRIMYAHEQVVEAVYALYRTPTASGLSRTLPILKAAKAEFEQIVAKLTQSEGL